MKFSIPLHYSPSLDLDYDQSIGSLSVESMNFEVPLVTNMNPEPPPAGSSAAARFNGIAQGWSATNDGEDSMEVRIDIYNNVRRSVMFGGSQTPWASAFTLLLIKLVVHFRT